MLNLAPEIETAEMSEEDEKYFCMRAISFMKLNKYLERAREILRKEEPADAKLQRNSFREATPTKIISGCSSRS